MSKDDEGRRLGHHITPGRGWRWQEFGGRLMLVTAGGGSDVVLSGGRDALQIMTCDADGRLVKFKPDSPLGLALAALPDLVHLLRDIVARDDRPYQLPRIRAVLAEAGLLESGGCSPAQQEK